jgi:hypothetical protein
MALSPYPGLRPFSRDEADIFFGRERQIDAMIDRLGDRRFLAVVGASGSGKSSLVRAGLLEALEMGLLSTAGPVWRIADLRPRDQPMTELAAALLKAFGLPSGPDDVALRRAALDRGPLSLIQDLREQALPAHLNLLILVDQFEELFRYQGLAGREEAEAFVALLLASGTQRDIPIYILLTMRADFFGECALFEELAEAISESLYLCPRLRREQILAAIHGPARVFGGEVEPALATRIINDMGTDPDQLPLMQHALMRLWETAQGSNPEAPILRLADFVAADGLKGSLRRHADEILAEATARTAAASTTAKRLFCLLSELDDSRAVRRLTRVSEVMAVAEQPLDEISRIADAFRAPGRSLLLPPADRQLSPETVLDVSHEALFRQWDVLQEWLREETHSVSVFREILRRARRWSRGEADPAGLWDPQELDRALLWREREHPNAAWAARYGGDFRLVDRFIEMGRKRRDRAGYGLIAVVASVVLAALASLLYYHSLYDAVFNLCLAVIGYWFLYRALTRNFAVAKATVTGWMSFDVLFMLVNISNRVYLYVWIDLLILIVLAYVLHQLRQLTRGARRTKVATFFGMLFNRAPATGSAG